MAKKRELNRIKEILESQDKTQSWLAGQLDMDFRTVNRYCSNSRQPSLERLFDIARILKVKVRELINE
jgi:putative transcriptional regulator